MKQETQELARAFSEEYDRSRRTLHFPNDKHGVCKDFLSLASRLVDIEDSPYLTISRHKELRFGYHEACLWSEKPKMRSTVSSSGLNSGFPIHEKNIFVVGAGLGYSTGIRPALWPEKLISALKDRYNTETETSIVNGAEVAFSRPHENEYRKPTIVRFHRLFRSHQ
jgi:hypothetical protein